MFRGSGMAAGEGAIDDEGVRVEADGAGRRFTAAPARSGGFWKQVLVVAAVVLVVVVMGAVAFSSRISGDDRVLSADEKSQVVEAATYRSLEDVAVDADALAEVVVTSVADGRTVGPSEDGAEDGVSFRNVSVFLVEVYASDRSLEVGDSLVLEVEEQPPFDLRWWNPGDRVILALDVKDESGPARWRYLNSQTVFLIDDREDDTSGLAGEVVPASSEGDLAAAWRGRSHGELRAAMRTAATSSR